MTKASTELRARLGGSASLLEPFPPRPRYMHHRTDQRLRARYTSLSGETKAQLKGILLHMTRRGAGATAPAPAAEAGASRLADDDHQRALIVELVALGGL